MGMGTFPQDGEELKRKEYGFWWGKVLDNVDPERRGRVKATVPGLFSFSPTHWVSPLGMPGTGAPEWGSYTPPAIDAQIVIGFIQGDLFTPFYFTGPPAYNEAPKAIRDASSDSAAANTVAMETKTFEIIIKDTDDEAKLILRTKSQSETIEIDAKDGSISIKASHFLILDAPLVSIKHRIQLGTNNRVVLPIGNPL